MAWSVGNNEAFAGEESARNARNYGAFARKESVWSARKNLGIARKEFARSARNYGAIARKESVGSARNHEAIARKGLARSARNYGAIARKELAKSDRNYGVMVREESCIDKEFPTHIFTARLVGLPHVKSYKEYVVLHYVKVLLEFQSYFVGRP